MAANLLTVAQAGFPNGNRPVVHVIKPANGQALTVPLDGAATLDFTAISTENITLVRVGDNLIVLFDNDATIAFGPVFDHDGVRPGLTFELAAGEELSGPAFAALVPITTDQSVLPAGAAGGLSGGGHFVDAPPVDPLDVVLPLWLPGSQSQGPAGPPGSANDHTLVNHFADHAPSALGDTGVVVEAGVHPGNTPFAGAPLASGNVLAGDADPDVTDATRVVGAVTAADGHVDATVHGAFGDLVLGADGTWSYTLDNTAAATQALAQGEHASEVFTYTISDTAGATASATLTIDIVGTNDAPVIVGAPPAATIDEASGQIHSAALHVIGDALVFTDVDHADSHTVGVALAAATWSGGAEIPAQTPADADLTARLALDGAGSGRVDWTFTVPDADLDFLAAGDTLALTYLVTVTDADGASAAQDVTITITGSNDAPVLMAAGPTLPAIPDDDADPSGVTVASLLGGHVSDADAGAVEGIAITGASASHGTWQYSLDGGATWRDLAAASPDASLLLDASDLVRFAPDYSGGGTEALSFVAWDETAGSRGGTADTTARGGSTAFSAQDDTAAISLAAANHAPVLTPSAPILPTLAANASPHLPGTTVANLIAGHVADADPNALQGIAINGASASHGSWQFSTDGGASWTDFGSYSPNAALLLAADDLVKFLPDGTGGGSESFSFVAWDQTAGSHGDTADATLRGGTSAFSSASDSASETVAFINSAPVLVASAPTLATITEDDTGNAGTTVATLLGNHLSDANPGTLQGIAITGATESHGTWQYSTDGGAHWTDFDSYSTSSALLLGASDLVRFLPDAAQGSADTFSFVAWDQTAGTEGHTADVTTRGGTTAFSTQSDTAAITVTDVDDAPAVHAPTEITIAEDTPFAFTGTSALSLSDVDAGDGGLSLGITVSHGTLTLPGLTGFPFTGALLGGYTLAQFNSALSASTFTPTQDFNGDATITITIDDRGNTGTGGPLSDTETITIHVTPVEDAPVAVDDTAVTDEDTPLTVDASHGVLANDHDPDAGDTLSVVAGDFATANGGTIHFDADGGYAYTPAHDFNGTDTVAYTVQDAAGATATGTLTITVDPVNDAPAVHAPTEITIAEDTPLALTGASALSLSDVDAGDGGLVLGITVTHGTLTLPGLVGFPFAGASLNGYTLAQFNSALSASTFTPTQDFNGDATITITIDDHGNTGAGGALSDTETITIHVTPVNDAPALTASAPSLPSIAADAIAPAGTTVATLLGTHVIDVDANALQGIAITGATESHGTWQFSTDNGATWSDFASYAVSSALLLGASDLLRFAPDGTTSSADTFSFVAWDHTSGAEGHTADVTTRGGDTAFSLASDTATITVTPINHPATIAALPVTVTALSDGFESGLGSPGWGITGVAGVDHQTVKSGTSSAEIIGGAGASRDDVPAALEGPLEAALNLPAGALATHDGQPATDGSAIATTLAVAPGTYTLAFDWQYQANDTLDFADDFAFAAINGALYRLADVASVNEGSSGWQHATITLDLAGAVTFGFGAMNTNDSFADGLLWVDNVTLTSASSSDHGVVTEDVQATASGVLVVTDPDPGEAALRAVTNGAAAHGHYTVAADGTWTYTLDNTDAAVDALAPGESLADGFTVTSLDGTATHAVTITIAGSNDAPTGTSATKTGTDTAPVSFASADFGFHDVDHGDGLGAVKIDTLPGVGKLLLNGVAVTAGAVIAAGDLGHLTFAPADRAADYATSFSFQVEDQHGAFDATPRTMTLQITATDDLPDGTDMTFSVGEASILAGFALYDFGFKDADQGDTFSGLKITTLPSAADGTVMVVDRTTGAMSAIAAGTVIAKSDLDLLRFVPVNKTASYDAHFSIQVEDSVGGFDPTPQTVTVHVNAVDDNPQYFAITRTVSEDASALSVDLLSDAGAHDADSPTLSVANVDASITTAGGRVLVEGIDYTVNGSDFELTAHGFGQFQVLPASHTDSFVLHYAISDGIVAPGNKLTVTVNGADEVGPAPPPPQVLSEITGLYASIDTGHEIRSSILGPPIGPVPTSISYAIPSSAVSGANLTWSMSVIYSSLQGTVAFNSSTNTISYDALPDTHSGLAILKLTATDPFGQSVDTYTTVTALDHGIATGDVYVTTTADINGGAAFIGNDGPDGLSFMSWTDPQANLAIGNGGDDYMIGNPSQIEAGDDAYYGGTGNDVLVAGDGTDFLSGGDGTDFLIGGAGNDVVLGGAGNDIIYIAGSDAAGDLLIDGGSGSDRIIIGTLTNGFTNTYVSSAELSSFGPQNSIESIASVGSSHATLQGTDGDNSFDFSITQLINVDVDMGGGNDHVVTSLNTNGTSYAGGSGTDAVTLLFTATQLETVLTDPTMRAAMGSYLDGTPADGTLSLALGASGWNGTVSGFETAELALSTGGSGYVVDSAIGATLPAFVAGPTGDGGDNLLVGTLGDDAGATALAGNGGNDILVGRDGNDTLDGGAGNDLLLGGSGNDRLIGGTGEDILSGGAGADTFRTNGPADGLDHILDFNSAEGDVIELLAAAFGLPAGTDASAVFGTDATPNAQSATERFHFDTGNHTLYYDADGSGAAATPIAIAHLENGANLIGSDIHLAAA